MCVCVCVQSDTMDQAENTSYIPGKYCHSLHLLHLLSFLYSNTAFIKTHFYKFYIKDKSWNLYLVCLHGTYTKLEICEVCNRSNCLTVFQSLDKVVMEMSTCDEPRPPNGPSPIATASGQRSVFLLYTWRLFLVFSFVNVAFAPFLYFSEYGFAEKVVEGISLSVNSIIIRISAKAFNASFELSQLQVYSVNTSWVTSDLRYTRIQDPARGEVHTRACTV